MIWVCLKIGNTPKPNGFADQIIPIKWLFHWEYTLFSDKPILMIPPIVNKRLVALLPFN